MKTCSVCKDTKPLEDFYNSKSSKDGKGYRCKVCDNKARRKYYLENENSHDKRRERVRRHRYKKFGITEEDYNKINTQQGGKCAICGGVETKSTSQQLSIDHCHSTGKIRGLLCNNCNRGLGLLGDTEDSIQKALDYLKETH